MSNISTTDTAAQGQLPPDNPTSQILIAERAKMRALSPPVDLFHLPCSDHARLMRGDTPI
ncbi:hypothetical protein OO012_05230 [Rhodobacteraceae bacterium KMM 6894]|nr:hypothetical protein [Rhodobacteraceae bacterium KMM 6894]